MTIEWGKFDVSFKHHYTFILYHASKFEKQRRYAAILKHISKKLRFYRNLQVGSIMYTETYIGKVEVKSIFAYFTYISEQIRRTFTNEFEKFCDDSANSEVQL
jgi:hypothetical protein